MRITTLIKKKAGTLKEELKGILIMEPLFFFLTYCEKKYDNKLFVFFYFLVFFFSQRPPPLLKLDFGL